LSVKGEKQQHR